MKIVASFADQRRARNRNLRIQAATGGLISWLSVVERAVGGSCPGGRPRESGTKRGALKVGPASFHTPWKRAGVPAPPNGPSLNSRETWKNYITRLLLDVCSVPSSITKFIEGLTTSKIYMISKKTCGNWHHRWKNHQLGAR